MRLTKLLISLVICLLQTKNRFVQSNTLNQKQATDTQASSEVKPKSTGSPEPQTKKPVVDNLQPVDLNVKTKSSSTSHNYTNTANIGTYTATKGHKFTTVRYNNKLLCCGSDVVIWQSDSAELYATKVEITPIEDIPNQVTVYLNEGDTRVYIKDPKKKIWDNEKDTVANESDKKTVSETPNKLTDPKYLEIDIDNMTSSARYTTRYISSGVKSDKVYLTKGDYRFKSVKEKSHVIWSTDKVDECANKVRVLKAYPIRTYIISVFINGVEKTFIKDSSNTWKESKDKISELAKQLSTNPALMDIC